MLTRTTLMALTWGALALAPTRAVDLPEQRLPIWGGSGGTAFSRSCGSGRVLTGLRYRKGLYLDAVGLLCRPVNADGSLGSETTVGLLAGGGGGSPGVTSCANGYVVGAATISYGDLVVGLRIHCYTWVKGTRSMGTFFTIVGISGSGSSSAVEKCEAVSQPVVAMRGRAGLVVDAVGFTCNEP
jgi:hypothetical protein